MNANNNLLQRRMLTVAMIIAVAALILGLYGAYNEFRLRQIPEYRLSERADISIPGESRIVFRVEISAEATEKGLLLISEDIDEKTIDNVTIFFYAPGDDVHGFYTVGMSERETKKSRFSITHGSASGQ